MKLALGCSDSLGYSLGFGVSISSLGYLPFLIDLITIIVFLSVLFCYKCFFPVLSVTLSIVVFFKIRL